MRRNAHLQNDQFGYMMALHMTAWKLLEERALPLPEHMFVLDLNKHLSNGDENARMDDALDSCLSRNDQ